METRWQNPADPIFHYAATRPDAPALIDGTNTLCYRDFAVLVGNAAFYLRQLGIGEGDRVGVALNNHTDHFIISFAILRMGAVLVELSAADDPEALAAAAQRYRIGTVFTEAHKRAPPGVRQIRVDLAWRGTIERLSGDYNSSTSAEERTIISLTTGSTGTPSGWVTTHRKLIDRIGNYGYEGWWNTHPVEGMTPPGNLFVVLPLRHIWTVITVLAQLFAGGPFILLPEYLKGGDYLRAFAAVPDGMVVATPGMCRYLLSAVTGSGVLLPNLRRIECGGQPLHADEKRAMLAQVTPNFYEAYGTTASTLISGLTPAEMIARADTLGRPPPGVDVEIVDSQGQPVAVGVAGEIRCRPYSALGQCEEDGGSSAEHIADGWCYTADIGFLDSDGYIHLRGRGADVIRRGAVEIYAPEVEKLLTQHPAIAEVAVIGWKKSAADTVEQLVAFVVKRGALDHAALVNHCLTHLPPHQRPDQVYYVNTLPRLAIGKVNRMRLYEIASEEAAREAAKGDGLAPDRR